MKINYVSDLHIDSHLFIGDDLETLVNNPLSSETRGKIEAFFHRIRPYVMGEILLIGGDLSNFNHSSIAFLKYAVEVYGEKKVILVHGNHDLYIFDRINYETYKVNSFNRLREFKDACEKIGAVFLDGDSVTVDGVKIAGCGMWYDNYFADSEFNMDDSMMRYRWSLYMNDYTHIRVKGERGLMYNGGYTFDYLKYARKQEEKLVQIYSDAKVILTHIAPTFKHFTHKYDTISESTFYQFDGRRFLNEHDERVWVFGHTHETHDFKIGKTRLLCNPIGYKDEFSEKQRLLRRKIDTFEIT